MKELHLDIETYSSVDLAECGVYRYAESPDFEILLLGWSADGGEVKVIDLARGETIPEEILAALKSRDVIKTAHNANFERVCLSRHLGMKTGEYLPPESWRCSMVWAAVLGLPQSLDELGRITRIGKAKMDEGKELVPFFSSPCKSSPGLPLQRNLPEDWPEKWELFKAYNRRDVEAEMEICEKLSRFPVPGFLWEEYCIDQKINDRGVAVALDLVKNAVSFGREIKEELTEKMRRLTSLENPTSVPQLREWLKQNGVETKDLRKETVADLLQKTDGTVHEVLLLRQMTSKSSVAKYEKMEKSVNADGRVRGCFRFYGAARTGRFSGKIVQLQNLPQNHLADLNGAREMVRAGDLDALRGKYPDVQDTLSQLIRTAFVPAEGVRFVQADFSSIEARVLAWLAGEEWKKKVFAEGGDIYCASASKMFKVPVVKNGINGELRQKGKVAELALGYGGSVGALVRSGALKMGLKEEELPEIVSKWRTSNAAIVKLWSLVENAVIRSVVNKTTVPLGWISMVDTPGYLFITLPSGRKLAYLRPKIETGKFSRPCLTFEGTGETNQFERQETYGAKLVENIVQGISRDILCYAMKNLQDERICMHVHDELIIETNRPADEICRVMGRTPPWAPGLLLRADGEAMEYYRKA